MPGTIRPVLTKEDGTRNNAARKAMQNNAETTLSRPFGGGRKDYVHLQRGIETI
jgi:hypothetical protein